MKQSNNETIKKYSSKVIHKSVEILLLAVLMLVPARAFAIVVGLPMPGHKGNEYASYMDYITDVLRFAVEIGGTLTVLMLMYAGYKYMTSQGNPSAINEAKEIIIGTLSGFILLLLIYFVLRFLGLPYQAG